MEGLLKEMTKEEKKQAIKVLRDNITARLNTIKDSKVPFVVIVEGWEASGKGRMINELIKNIDPRFYAVFVNEADSNQERYSFMYPYFNAIPEDGKFRFYDGAYMQSTLEQCFDGKLSQDQYNDRIQSVNNFERTLINNGYAVLKIFLNISRKEQMKRMNKLLDNKDTAWRVQEKDLRQNANYKAWKKAYFAFMEETSLYSPWNVVDVEDRTSAKYEGFKLLSDAIDNALENGKFIGEPYEEEFEMKKTPLLKDVDLDKSVSEEEYEERLEKLQDEVKELHGIIRKKHIPVICAFEGWDAAGKGGAIRRLAYPLDPRGFVVEPIASPDQYEKARHFLWRFYKRLPKTGHVTIFDRTWYGRVMVERLEGFCSENDWKRAYNEINEFETELVKEGAVVLKFWIHIDKDTQLARFTERQNTPEKQWKITDEDWRNRDKWDDYEVAIDEMIQKTSTKLAPWHIVESNDKLYARLKVLEIVKEALEKAIKEK